MVVMRQGVLSSLVKPVSWDLSETCQELCVACTAMSVVSRPSGVVMEVRGFFSGRSGFNTNSLCATGWFVLSESLMVEPSSASRSPWSAVTVVSFQPE